MQATPLARAPLCAARPPAHRRQAIRQQQRSAVAVRAAADDEQQAQSSASSSSSSSSSPPPPPADVCRTCGVPLSNKAFGCDGEGRIAGGIGAVPGFRWWPIKAYRPCPRLEVAGVRYQRKGQITDEVLFGKGRQ